MFIVSGIPMFAFELKWMQTAARCQRLCRFIIVFGRLSIWSHINCDICRLRPTQFPERYGLHPFAKLSWSLPTLIDQFVEFGFLHDACGCHRTGTPLIWAKCSACVVNAWERRIAIPFFWIYNNSEAQFNRFVVIWISLIEWFGLFLGKLNGISIRFVTSDGLTHISLPWMYAECIRHLYVEKSILWMKTWSRSPHETNWANSEFIFRLTNSELFPELPNAKFNQLIFNWFKRCAQLRIATIAVRPHSYSSKLIRRLISIPNFPPSTNRNSHFDD